MLLLACARTKPSAESATTLCRLLAGPIDWEKVLSLAARHRVRPLLQASLNSFDCRAVPDYVRATLREFTSANARRSLYLISELFKVLDLFESRGIEVGAFKGPVLAATAYGSPAFREAGDLDLLVRRRDIVRVKQLLLDAGFHAGFPTTLPHESAYLQSLTGSDETHYLLNHVEHHFGRIEGRLNLDVHWGLALREFWLQLKPDELFRWLTPQLFAGRKILGLAPEQTLLMLCINGSKDCWERLDRICDIAELLDAHRSLDWTKIIFTATKLGMLRMLFIGLSLAGTLLDAGLPPQIAEMIGEDGFVPQAVARIHRQLFAPLSSDAETASLGRSIFHLQMRERLHDRIGYCLAHLEPTIGDWASVPLPRSLSFLHYGIRPLRLMWGRLIANGEA